MKLKSFHAKTMTEAMRLVRDALGEDAIIVNSREDGGMIKVTAAVEHIPTTPDPEPEFFDSESSVEAITEALLRHSVPASVSDKIISTSMTLNEKDPQKMLAKSLQMTFGFEGVSLQKPVVLVGPPGAGKTLMAAKMAARAVLNGQKPTVISTDTARAGGMEQLSAFLNILSVPLGQAEDVKTLRAALAGHYTPTIIDTGGLNPFDPQEMKHLARLLAVEDMEASLVLPAGIDTEESAEIALTFRVLGVRKLIPTRLDFARRMGGILSAADKAEMSFAEASHTPLVADGITMMTQDVLSNMLMPVIRAEAAKRKAAQQ